jgi:hypothetical protein
VVPHGAGPGQTREKSALQKMSLSVPGCRGQKQKQSTSISPFNFLLLPPSTLHKALLTSPFSLLVSRSDTVLGARLIPSKTRPPTSERTCPTSRHHLEPRSLERTARHPTPASTPFPSRTSDLHPSARSWPDHLTADSILHPPNHPQNHSPPLGPLCQSRAPCRACPGADPTRLCSRASEACCRAPSRGSRRPPEHNRRRHHMVPSATRCCRLDRTWRIRSHHPIGGKGSVYAGSLLPGATMSPHTCRSKVVLSRAS